MSVTLGIDTALRGIPNLSGGTEADLSSYITEYNYVMDNIHENIKTVVFHNIVSKLTGDAYQATRYRDFADWIELKNHLRNVFGVPHIRLIIYNPILAILDNDPSSTYEAMQDEQKNVTTN